MVWDEEEPIDFLMESLPNINVALRSGVEDKIGREAATRLLAGRIRRKLMTDVLEPLPFSITIAICTKDHPDLVERCLASLALLNEPVHGAPVSVDILVVDNASTDDRTERLVAKWSSVHYVQERRPGLNFARNRALEEASNTFIAFLDDDTTVDPGWLNGLLEAWRENPDADAFTGLILPYELETEAQILFERRGGFRRGFEKTRYHGDFLEGSPQYPCGAGIFGAGANMAFRCSVLRELGGFDEALDTGAPLPGGGDLDMFYRIVRHGYVLVYEPKYLVYHQHRREMKALKRQYWTWGQGFMAFVVKSYLADPTYRPRFRRLVWWWSKYMLVQVVRALRGRHVLPISFVMGELSGGLVGLCGEYQRSQQRIKRIKAAYP